MSMGHALRTAYSILDDIIARKGEDGFLVEIEHEVICGRKLLEIAQAEGLLYSVLWNWLKDVPERLERYRSALKGYGDALISETVGIADGRGDAKLMVDTRFKVICAGRRLGKTRFAIVQSIIKALECKDVSASVMLIAPTFGMARNLHWDTDAGC